MRRTFLANLAQPDNLPIALMVPAFAVLLLCWWRWARRNDRLLETGGLEAVKQDMDGPLPAPGEHLGPADRRKVHTWPYLVRIELVALLVVMFLLTVWSIVIDAPLEQMADATRTPNPSKAPWYFLGLQEMLVYFDPWIAGVVLPLLIIVGLCLIPYLDTNPAGSGYYAWRSRRFAISVFLFGFVGLWLTLILIGTFFRGPGWGWYWPWEVWDPSRPVDHSTITWAELFGIASPGAASAFGACTLAAYFASPWFLWRRRRHRPTLRQLGATRFALISFLFLCMMGLPIKILLRLALSVKYVWTTPWFNI